MNYEIYFELDCEKKKNKKNRKIEEMVCSI
jgi:hypothetical protein